MQGLTLIGTFSQISFGRISTSGDLFGSKIDKNCHRTIVGVDGNFNIPTDPNSLTAHQSVFIYKESTIPREVLADNFKRVIKKEKADVVVIPNNYVKGRSWSDCNAVFTKDDSAVVLVAYDPFDSINVGDPFPTKKWKTYSGRDYFPDNLKDYKLAYKGYYFSELEPVICDIVDGSLDGKILVTDYEFNKFAKSLLDDEGYLDLFYSIMELVKSTDTDSVFLGYKMLAGLDYSKYIRSAEFLIQYGNSCGRNPGTAINFMIDFIQKNKIRDKITAEDWEIYHKLIIKSQKMSFLCNATFVTINDDLRIVPRLA